MGSDFERPRNRFSYKWGGMKLNSTPDSLPVGKYPIAINIRALGDDTLQGRPGTSIYGGLPAFGETITDMRAYVALGTNSTPVLLARDTLGNIYSITSGAVGSFPGGGADLGVSMIPFRPGASPQPWMYIAGSTAYQKFSAPSPLNVITQQKVGIAEPQSPPEAAVTSLLTGFFTIPVTPAGTAGTVVSGTRFTDVLGLVFAWPSPATNIYSVQISGSQQYQRYQNFNMSGGAFGGFVLDVYPSQFTATAIQGIYYFTGTTGRCIVVPATVGPLPDASAQAVYPASWLASLRRGMLVFIGGECCMILSVSVGPNGSISFETSTAIAHSTVDTIVAAPSITVCMSVGVPVFGATISYGYEGCTVTTGVGTMTSVAATIPFTTTLGQSFQVDDYILVSFKVDVLTNLNEIKVLFDVGDGSFTQNFYYFSIRPSDLTGAIAATSTLTQLAAAQIVTQRAIIDQELAVAAKNQGQTVSSLQLTPGNSQWAEVLIPISALTRVGDDQSLTLQNLGKVQFLFNASGTIIVQFSDFNVIGGGQVDVGDAGAPLQYRVRPRSSVTGARGNPSPATRYGVLPRRQSVLVSLPSAAYDSQIDTWDVFRYGGAVTSWRYIGSAPSTSGLFTDIYNDAAATAGEPLDFDNFEPWPSIDVPNNELASVVGTTAVAFSTNPNILNYLPGTLVRIGGQNVFTLWTRPTFIGGNFYLLQFVENAGAEASATYNIQEPVLANQHLPYMWGPNAYGTIFAVGDPLRPGSVYFSKRFAPDSAPDSYNMEITPPSEPLLGGEILDGLAFVGSSERWWALYPTGTAYIQAVQSSSQQFSAIQQPIKKGLAAPFGHCNDGQSIYFWAKDGIESSTKGSLTDADLYNLFPHEGVAGENVTYNGQVVPAPDYSRVGTFRLTYSNGFLYALYQDSNGTYQTLTLDMDRNAWCLDQYTMPVTCYYHPEQPAASLTLASVLYPELLIAFQSKPTFISTHVAVQRANSNDFDSSPIHSLVATNEFDGGDSRAPKQWGDLFMDLIPAASGGVAQGVIVTPMSQGAAIALPTIFHRSGNRTRLAMSVGGILVSDFMGVQAEWIDDFSNPVLQSVPTQLILWQPSFVVQPTRTISWTTFGTSFGLDGYMHLRQLSIAYKASTDVTITISVVDSDGIAPAPIVLPASAFTKVLFPLTFNKGKLYRFTATSISPFQIFPEDSSIYVGAWGRKGPYLQATKFGGSVDAPSPI